MSIIIFTRGLWWLISFGMLCIGLARTILDESILTSGITAYKVLVNLNFNSDFIASGYSLQRRQNTCSRAINYTMTSNYRFWRLKYEMKAYLSNEHVRYHAHS